MSDETIQSILTEERTFPPSKSFAASARIKSMGDYQKLRAAAEQDHTGFWADLARNELDWHTPFKTILDDSKAPHFQWFTDGKLNVSYNCIDRHLEERGDKAAIVWEGEPEGESKIYTYRLLYHEVCKFANVLKKKGVKKNNI